ncbi:MAG: energy-coupling factor transporter transmembrane component T [Eubacteriales bacterium]|nr:energy-coupling factor transporter transmembrane component T [Eubacteriales bacterium]
MDKFSNFNPKVCFLFFVFTVLIILLNFNPIFLCVSLLSGVIYNAMLQGKKTFKTFFTFLLPFTLLVGIFNMAFTSYGVDILFSISNKNFTAEGLSYGLCQGVMFSSVIVWLSSYSYVLSSDKFMSVFSKLAPNLTLVLTMTLSFIPRLRKNAQEINDARLNVNTNQSKFKKSLDNFSSLVSMTLEESIEVSDTMRARNFNSSRKPYSKYRFNLDDGIVLLVLLALSISCIVLNSLDKAEFIFDPEIKMLSFSPIFLILYTIYMFLPVIINISEGIKWHFLKQKI